MPLVDLGISRRKNAIENNAQLNQTNHIEYVAAIDIGTNSTHLLIAAVDSGLKTFSIILADKSTTRLGERDPLTGDLTEDAMQRGLDALKRFKDIADGYQVKSVVAAATSAVREASNGTLFIKRIKDHMGLNVEVISGTEEARLIYLGVLSGMQFGDKPHLLIDVGGGSTELVLADGYDSKALTSTKVGAVQLQTEFIKQEPLSTQRVGFLKTFIEGALNSAIDKISRRLKPGENPLMIATSGTAMAIGQLILDERANPKSKLQGLKISKSELDKLTEKLLKLTSQERKKLPAISDRRAEIIVPGSLILQTSMQMLRSNELILSERALREGLVVDWMFRQGFLQDRFSLQGNIRQRTVLHQAKRFRVNIDRAKNVAKHALTLYDTTYGLLHHDEGSGRDLLWAASMLHACGRHINLTSYHKHSWYLIRHGELLGYSQIEHLMVAAIARYHRKSFPKKRHESWLCLDRRRYRQIVSEMALLLRLVCSLDRRPEPAVESIQVNKESRLIKIKLISGRLNQNLRLEKWSLRNTVSINADNIPIDIKVMD